MFDVLAKARSSPRLAQQLDWPKRVSMALDAAKVSHNACQNHVQDQMMYHKCGFDLSVPLHLFFMLRTNLPQSLLQMKTCVNLIREWFCCCKLPCVPFV